VVVTTVFLDQPDLPGLHALVVGVGDYGAIGADGVMLQSAAPSAEAIASWLYGTYANPDTPLRSLEVLLSPSGTTGPTPLSLIAGSNGRNTLSQVSVERACMGLTRQNGPVPPFGIAGAMTQWYERANLHQENMSLLYLCGHGALIVSDEHFFCERFDTSSAAASLADAINLRTLLSAMVGCLARRQVFLFDCCRDAPSWATTFTSVAGAPIVQNLANFLPNIAPLAASVIYATPILQKAGADTAAMSRFARGLLEVFRGPACDPRFSNNGPTISTRRILDALEELKDVGVLPDWGRQSPSTGTLDRFALHTPATPEVPVILETGILNAGESVQVNGAATAAFGPDRWLVWWPMNTRPTAAVVTAGVPSARTQDLVAVATYTWSRL